MSATDEHWAKEAKRLQEDATFQRALDRIRSEALDKLANEKAENTYEIIRLQQRAQVVEEIRSELGLYVGAVEDDETDAGPAL